MLFLITISPAWTDVITAVAFDEEMFVKLESIMFIAAILSAFISSTVCPVKLVNVQFVMVINKRLRR
jgi:hypothetical protein